MARRQESQFQFYSRSPAIERAGQALLDRYPKLADYATDRDTAGTLYLRVLTTFADPAHAHSQRRLLGLRDNASRAEIIKAFSRAMDGVVMSAAAVPAALEAAQKASLTDRLYDKMAGNEADAARARNGGRAPVEKPERRKLNDEEIRREDVKAAIRQHGGAVDPGDRSNGRHRPSSSLATDVAISMWQHGATDREIEVNSPGVESWAKEGSHADRLAAVSDAYRERAINERANEISSWAVPDDDGQSDDDNQNEVNDDR